MKQCMCLLGVVCLALPGFGQALSDSAAARFLDQATWGPTPASIAQLQQMGINPWLAWQLSLNSSDLPDQPVNDSSGKPNRDITPVQRAFFENALSGQDQLRQRIAFALSEIWVVAAPKVGYAYAIPPYWRVLRDNAFGNYRALIQAVTLNPAMGRYLNMANNVKGDAALGTSANENYAREVMQLFTIGVTQLNSNGSPALDSSHNPVPTYNQAIVTNMAKALTGWTYPAAPQKRSRNTNPPYFFGQMIPVEAHHDTTAKTIVGNVNVPSGQTAEQDLNSVIDALMAQPSMAPFISEQLIQHLVTSNPSPAYIQRVASVFGNDGAGVQGDLKAVITAILTDPEGRAGDSGGTPDPQFGHLREPVLLLANLLRGFNAKLTSASRIDKSAAALGQTLFAPPSVFSYFSPQYRIPGGLLGPEFQIYSTQTAASRADLIDTILYGSLDPGTAFDLSAFTSRGANAASLTDYISYAFFHHQMSSTLQSEVEPAARAAPNPQAAARDALYVALTASEYQIVH